MTIFLKIEIDVDKEYISLNKYIYKKSEMLEHILKKVYKTNQKREMIPRCITNNEWWGEIG